MTTMSGRCIRCRTRKALQPPDRRRGLCWTCANDPALRDAYPSESKFGNRITDESLAKLAGLAGPMSQAQIADVLGVTRSAVQAIEQRALRKLAAHPDVRRLAEECGVRVFA